MRRATPRALAVSVLIALSFAARFPALAHPDTTNSDAAIVGLQAMHVLRGELSPLLWGSTYQTSVDAVVAAGFFGLFGASPLVLMLSALSLHAALTVLVFLMLESSLGRPRALLLSLLLVFTGAAIHSYALYPPRQAALTLAVAALLVLDRACSRAHAAGAAPGPLRVMRSLTMGSALASFSIYADPYALVLVPGAVVLGAYAIAAPVTRRPETAVVRERVGRALAVALGALIGAVPLFLLARHPSWKSGEASLSLSVLGRNARLLLSPCGPWAYGTAVYRPLHAMDYVVWDAPFGVALIQKVGGLLLVLGAFVAPLSLFSRRVSASARRLGVVGAALAWGTLAGFLLSVMVMDHFSMRYLAASVIAAPLSLAPLADLLGDTRAAMRRLAALVMPMLASGWIGGWASFGAATLSGSGTGIPGRDDERALLADLERQGIHAAVADYWVSYRLTFLTGERLIVVPSRPAQDRHPTYRSALSTARTAYIVDSLRSDESAVAVEARLRARPPSEGVLTATLRHGTMTAFVLASRSD